MDPLVDEYMDPKTKLDGTQLKAMPRAIKKLQEFNYTNVKVFGSLFTLKYRNQILPFCCPVDVISSY